MAYITGQPVDQDLVFLTNKHLITDLTSKDLVSSLTMYGWFEHVLFHHTLKMD